MAETAIRGESGRPPRTLFGELEKRSVFTDLSVFDTDYIPDHIFVRKEFDPIVQFYFDALKSSLQQTMTVVGPSGSGKTLGCRYYADQAAHYAAGNGIPFSSAYVNCREIAAPYVFWQVLLGQFNTAVPKGFSITDLLTRLTEALAGRRHVVIVLDELEKLFARVGSERTNDILYSLARLRANRNLDTAISTIFISNNAHLPDLLDGPVRSSLNSTNLALGSYGAQELIGILTDRAQAGLKEGCWNTRVVHYAAAKTAQYNSDARFAIRLLRNAARYGESLGGAVSTDHVDTAFEETRREMELHVLNHLSSSQLLVLEALALQARARPGSLISLHAAYSETYQAVCERHVRKPLVYSHFLSVVSALQSFDLAKNVVEKRGTGGYARLVETNFNPADVIRVAERALSSGGGPAEDRPGPASQNGMPEGCTAPAPPASAGQFHFRLRRF